MCNWRDTALSKFPTLNREISDAEDADGAWFAILGRLEEVYGTRPLDEQFVADVFEYASWCLNHPSIDIRTSVVSSFYERLPNHNMLHTVLPGWMTQADFDKLDFAWEYVLKDDDKIAAFKREFSQKKIMLEAPARKKRKLRKEFGL